MITIERSEILTLLMQYNKKKFRRKTDVIVKLQAFLNPEASDDTGVKLIASQNNTHNILNQDELYKLALILLTRDKSTQLFRSQQQKLTKSEVLAQTLEDKFGHGEFQSLKEYFTHNNGLLTQDDFNRMFQDAVAENAPLNPSADVQPPDVKLFGDDVILRIGELSFPSAMRLAQTSWRNYRLFSANQKFSEKNNLLRELLSHAALGELAAAEKIWSEHLDLLTCYGTVFHPNRIYEGNNVVDDIPFYHNPGRYKYTQKTILQILWMNEEYEAAELIKDRLSPHEWSRQFLEVFPDGMIKKNNFDLDEAKKLLQAVFVAIRKDDSLNLEDLDVMNMKTRYALNALYAYAKPSNDVKTGLVFDVNFYLATLALYDAKLLKIKSRATDEERAKNQFWIVRVEEWLAGCLGTGYFRHRVQGFFNQDNPLIGCILANGTSGFAFRRDVRSIPGLHFHLGLDGWESVRQYKHEFDAVSTIMSNKKQYIDRLVQACNSTLKQNRIT